MTLCTTARPMTIGICDGETDVNVEITYRYTPPCRGSFERGGRQIEPDAGAEVSLVAVWMKVGAVKVDISGLISGQHRAEIEDEIANEHEGVAA